MKFAVGIVRNLNCDKRSCVKAFRRHRAEFLPTQTRARVEWRRTLRRVMDVFLKKCQHVTTVKSSEHLKDTAPGNMSLNYNLV